MRRSFWSTLLLFGGLFLSGCATQQAAAPVQMTEAQAIALLRTGQPVLRCREACLTAWRQVQPQAAQYAAERRWRPLAVLVLNTGYQDDLTLYYLGRAAEGLGFPVAAGSFYQQSLQLSGTSVSCANSSRQCGGVALPQETSLRLAAIHREFARPPRRRTGPPREGAPPQEPSASEEPLPPPRLPEATSLPQQGQNPAPSQYIEPPPAAR